MLKEGVSASNATYNIIANAWANDGDADRIGMYDEKGNFVDSHRLLLLLLKYMKEYKLAQRRLYKEKIMDRMDAENRRAQREEAEREYESQFSDMPDLE